MVLNSELSRKAGERHAVMYSRDSVSIPMAAQVENILATGNLCILFV